MFYKKKGIPQEGDIVLCTVKNILSHSVFVDLDEYNHLEGLLHISEVSPGRIRNLRDFVVPGKKIVCKVLRAQDEKHIDLSLRRVPMNIRIGKINEYKQELKAERMLEHIGKDLNFSIENMYEKVGYKAIEEFGSLGLFFQNILSDNSLLKKMNIDEKISNILIQLIKEKIKIPEVEVSGTLVLQSYKEEGINKIKGILINEIKDDVKISYLSAPRYRISVKSKDYKGAENILKGAVDRIITNAEQNGCTGEFIKNA
ncbi:MAG: S1 RNA-binding domain-containing protein [Nanoarchaeota archaeon]|nr:S1 RNA-binding domain-containing protein [Nanoarchaeota archaeon]MBU0963311.1 S1 RNA-binding domain-containing protein [Nanoarchaeota archaeon]